MSSAILFEKGYVLKDGLINHEKINYLSGATTRLLVEMIWEASENDIGILEHLFDSLYKLYERQQEAKMVELIRFLYDLTEIDLPEDVDLLWSQDGTRSSYLHEMLMDMRDVMYDLY